VLRAALICVLIAGCGEYSRVVMLVTWFADDKPPQSYQQEFGSMSACEAARSSLVREAERLEAEQARHNAEMQAAIAGRGLFVPGRAPSLTAVCSPQK
jgi:hypothetical protein